MYPNNNQQPTPIDYLNQIAPHQQPKLALLTKKPLFLAGIGLAIFIVLITIIVIISSLSGGISPTKRLAGRLNSTAATVTKATESGYIKSSQLRAYNSELKLYLANTISDVTPILAAQGIKITNLDKDVQAAESNAKLLSVLDDARLNAIYDRTYAREMAYQLDTLLTLMSQINNSTSNKDMKNYLTEGRKNLEPIQKEFADFNTTNS